MNNLEEELKVAISKVNSTLKKYSDDGNISQMRYDSPECPREDCKSFEQYVECRLNYECAKIPALKNLVEKTQGHLFICTGLTEEDLVNRRYKRAYFKLLTPMMVVDEDMTDEIRSGLKNLRKALGGNEISFNSVIRTIKLVINDK